MDHVLKVTDLYTTTIGGITLRFEEKQLVNGQTFYRIYVAGTCVTLCEDRRGAEIAYSAACEAVDIAQKRGN